MGRNLDTLTSLFLSGSFSDWASEPGSSRRGSPEALRPEPPRVVQARAAATPARRAARQRTALPPAAAEAELTHPGQVLAEQLADLGLTASDLARDIDVPVNRVTAIINGQRGVTADTALRLAHWFEVDPEDWLGLQLEYELALSLRETGAKVKKLPRLADRFA